MRRDSVEDLLLACARLEHRGRHVPERAEQPVAVLEPGDEQPARQRRADEVGRGFQEDVGGGRPSHGGERVAAEHDQVAVRLIGVTERKRRDDVELSHGRPGRDRVREHRFPGRRLVVPIDPRRRGDRRMCRDQLEACSLGRELIDGRGVEVARQQEVGERDREQAPQLLGVGLRVADGCGEQRRQPAQPVERGTLRLGQHRLDGPGRGVGTSLELLELRRVGDAFARAVVEVDESEQPVP